MGRVAPHGAPTSVPCPIQYMPPHGDFLAIFKSDYAHSGAPGHATLSMASTRRQGGYLGTVSECPSEQCAEAASEICSDAEHSAD